MKLNFVLRSRLSVDNQKITIDHLENLPSGIYWYVVSAGNRIKQGKIVKQ